MSRKTGFTLIELLVVIAIIAILAAIIFPVFMRAKDAAYRSGDLSNLNAIRNALQLYRADQEAYPPQILGYATVYTSGPEINQLIPAGSLRGALYPKRINSIETLRPAYDRVANNLVTAAIWPNSDPRPPLTAPILDLNGDGIIDNTDDIPQARQAYDPNSPNPYFCSPDYLNAINFGSTCDAAFVTKDSTTPLDPSPGRAAPFYKISGYDVANVRLPTGSPATDRWELRYTLRWSSYAFGGGNVQDDPRQLIYSDPPDNTVVSWNSWFREYDSGNLPMHEKRDYVLFLGGGVRPYDSADISARSWRVMP